VAWRIRNVNKVYILSGDAAVKAYLIRVCMDCKLSLHVNLVYKDLGAAGENSNGVLPEKYRQIILPAFYFKKT
jgi:hypothetical protein